MKMQLHFSGVGRNKMSWTDHIDANPLDVSSIEDAAVRCVRKKKALMSRDVEVVLHDPDGGIVYAGFRPVGVVSLSPRVSETVSGDVSGEAEVAP